MTNTALKENHDNLKELPIQVEDKVEIEEVVEINQVSDKPGPSPKPATIHVNFTSNSDKIKITSKATGEKSVVVAANKKIHLIHGRLYFIPVDSEVNSDEYGNMKQFSHTTDKYDVKYIKNGIACIDPILHNAIIENSQQLCVLW